MHSSVIPLCLQWHLPISNKNQRLSQWPQFNNTQVTLFTHLQAQALQRVVALESSHEVARTIITDRVAIEQQLLQRGVVLYGLSCGHTWVSRHGRFKAGMDVSEHAWKFQSKPIQESV